MPAAKQSATHEQVGEKELAKMKKRNEKEERSARAALAAHQATREQLLCTCLAQQQLQPAYLFIMWMYRALRECSPWGYEYSACP